MCKGDSITFTKPEAPRVPRPDEAKPEICSRCGQHWSVPGEECRVCSWIAKHDAGMVLAAKKRAASPPRSKQIKKKGLPVPPRVKFLYFGRPEIKNPKHLGIVTVAWIEPSPGTLHLGFSFCSPKDPWCKATGRDIALTRLLHPLVIPFLYSPRRTVHEVARAVMSHDFVRLAAIAPGVTMWGLIPSWTKDLAKRMWPMYRPRSPRITFRLGQAAD